MDKKKESLYDILGVTDKADAAEIKSKYKKLALVSKF